jgi:hypothetical protein
MKGVVDAGPDWAAEGVDWVVEGSDWARIFGRSRLKKTGRFERRIINTMIHVLSSTASEGIFASILNE